MMDNEVIHGADKMLDAMAKLESNVQRKYATKAARTGANKIRDRARSLAGRVDNPRTPEDIEKNIVTHAMGKRFVPDGVGMRVGVLGGARAHAEGEKVVAASKKENPGGDTFYWRFLEFGTAHAKAEPFMRPAAEASASEALEAVAASLQKQLFG